MSEKTEKIINIVVPMAGSGKAFKDAGYSFPKPLIDVHGKTMIEAVVENLRPAVPHHFIFICLREQYEKYDFYNVFKNVTDNKFSVVLLGGPTHGAAVTVLSAIEHINNDSELIIANADQYLEWDIGDFIADARKRNLDGSIVTFKASHPKWSYARIDANNCVVETAEKKVISDKATAGIYYFKTGADFVQAAQEMVKKNIRHDNQFFVCPAYNELIIGRKVISFYDFPHEKMHGMGAPEDLVKFVQKLEAGAITKW